MEFLWRLLVGTRRLTPAEISVAAKVLGPATMRYAAVRVASGGILTPIFRLNRQRAFVLFHTVNVPPARQDETALLLHELVHVLQYELVGSVYIYEALRAQRREGYDYGGWERLARDRAAGKRFAGYNREQQGRIVQDYWLLVVAKDLPPGDPVRQAYGPFIDELRRGLV